MQYIDIIPKTVEEVVVPLITSCLENYPVDRPTAEEVCDQLETLVVNRSCTLPDNLLKAQLELQKAQQKVEICTAELQKARSELHSKVQDELDTLRSEMSRLQVFSDHPACNLQVIP